MPSDKSELNLYSPLSNMCFEDNKFPRNIFLDFSQHFPFVQFCSVGVFGMMHEYPTRGRVPGVAEGTNAGLLFYCCLVLVAQNKRAFSENADC